MSGPARIDALVVGGGPAGLMAAEAMAGAGRRVLVAEAMPSPARKLLMAGKTGLNLTRMDPFDEFLAAYGPAAARLEPMLGQFGPAAVRDWAEGLGQPVFTGSTGRVYPRAMKASPLLRAWLERLGAMRVTLRRRWRWAGWDGPDTLLFDVPEGRRALRPAVTVLACGGASWARLGSDGTWAAHMAGGTVPFRPANMGFNVEWSAHMEAHFGAPVKNVALCAGGQRSRGEFVISRRGLEGGGIYALAAAMRDGAPLLLDLMPDLDIETLRTRLARPRGRQSLSNHLRRTLGLDRSKQALLMEFVRPLPPDAAPLIKALPVRHAGPRPLDEAISTAGGLRFDALDAGLMLRHRPGIFAAGEMLDWEAPTGGYLLTACLATGLWAGRHAAAYRPA